MNRNACLVLAVAFLAAWFIGFSSLALYLWHRNAPAPLTAANVEAFQFRFGILTNDGQSNYSISQETTTIPMRFGDSTYGFQVIPPDDKPYNVQFIYRFPYPPKTISGEVFESKTPSTAMRSVKTQMQGGYVQDMGFDPGDPIGDQSIEIYIDDKLATTIKFKVTPPAADPK